MELTSKINQDTCVRQVRAMRNISFMIEFDCRECNEFRREKCEWYQPVKNGGDVRYGYLRLYQKQ